MINAPDFTSWVDLDQIDVVRGTYEFSRVYSIRVTNADTNPVQINRFLGLDMTGLITIGHSGNVGKRVSQFNKAIRGEGRNHTEGLTMYQIKLSTDFNQRYLNYKMQFAAKQFKNVKRAQEEEEIMFRAYFNTYGELPPLNHSQPQKHGIWVI